MAQSLRLTRGFAFLEWLSPRSPPRELAKIVDTALQAQTAPEIDRLCKSNGWVHSMLNAAIQANQKRLAPSPCFTGQQPHQKTDPGTPSQKRRVPDSPYVLLLRVGG